MGIWEKGKQIRELTKEDIEQLELQPQELLYGKLVDGEDEGGEEEEEGSESEQEEHKDV